MNKRSFLLFFKFESNNLKNNILPGVYQAETLLYGLERADTSIGLHVNEHKTEYMCFN